MNSSHLFAFVFIGILSSSSAGLCPSAAPFNAPGSTTFTLSTQIDGYTREALVHIPGRAPYNGLSAYPMVISFHGWYGTAAGMEGLTGFSTIADREVPSPLRPASSPLSRLLFLTN